MQHFKKNNDVISNHSTLHILKNRKFSRHGSFAKLISIKFPFHRYILTVEVWRKKYAQKGADVSDLVISRDVSLKTFNKNEHPDKVSRFYHKLEAP